MIFTVWHAVILGITQAVTEFLPISSSAHLIIVRNVFHIPTLGTTDLAVDALLQLGTLFAVLLYFWKDIKTIFIETPINLIIRNKVTKENKNVWWGIVVGTIPVLVAGVLLEKTMQTTFRGLHFVLLFLFLGTVFMIIAERYTQNLGARLPNKMFTWVDGLWIGLAQVLALFSGFSRSGATISGGLLRGFSRTDAVRISFLLSFPAILLSGSKKAYDVAPLLSAHTLPVAPLVVGFFISAALGFFVIHYLLKFVKNYSFNLFIAYRFILLVFLLIFLL